MLRKYSSILFLSIFLICAGATYGQKDLIESIYFQNNSFIIEKRYEPILDSVAAILRTKEHGYLKIFGYADTKGPEDHNEWLSGKRANAVFDYLSARVKLNNDGIYVEWIGESDEAYDLHFPGAHIRQRCVDIWVAGIR